MTAVKGDYTISSEAFISRCRVVQIGKTGQISHEGWTRWPRRVLSESSLAVDFKKKKIAAGLLFGFPIWVTENQPAIRIFKCILIVTFRSMFFKVMSKSMEECKVQLGIPGQACPFQC